MLQTMDTMDDQIIFDLSDQTTSLKTISLDSLDSPMAPHQDKITQTSLLDLCQDLDQSRQTNQLTLQIL